MAGYCFCDTETLERSIRLVRKLSFRRKPESRRAACSLFFWIPAYAGMTIFWVSEQVYLAFEAIFENCIQFFESGFRNEERVVRCPVGRIEHFK